MSNSKKANGPYIPLTTIVNDPIKEDLKIEVIATDENELQLQVERLEFCDDFYFNLSKETAFKLLHVLKAFLGLGRNKSYSEMETKHTPAPWYTVISPESGKAYIGANRDHFIIELLTHEWDFEETNANAQVAAAAPELLDALCAVLRSYEAACPERYYSDDNVALADDVIKKAIG